MIPCPSKRGKNGSIGLLPSASIGDAAPDGVSAAKMPEFEAAAALRDQIIKLRGEGK